MTSKQDNEQVLGFTPAWVIAYVLPGQGRKAAYDVGRNLGFRLNIIDFEIDRYELDRSQTLNWDPNTDQWIPQPPAATTFDAFARPPNLQYEGYVDYATNEAYSDINQRSLAYIAARGGIEGDIGRQIAGRTIIFRRQEGFANITVDQAFTDFDAPCASGYACPGTVLPQNERTWVYRIAVSLTDIVTLVPVIEATTNDYVQILRGTYINQLLYLPNIPGPGQTLRTWSNIPETAQTPTIFDGGSTTFNTPADRWVATNEFDKYLVFPKRTILG